MTAVFLVSAAATCRGSSSLEASEESDNPPTGAIQQAGAPAPAMPDGAIATLGGLAIDRDDFAEWLLQVHGPGLLAEYLDQRLVSATAKGLGIELDPAAVSEAVEREWFAIVKLRFDGDETAYLDELSRLGHNRESYQLARSAAVAHRLLLTRVAGAQRDISEEALRAFFLERFGDTSERIKIQVLYLERRRLMRDPKRMPAGAAPQNFDDLQEITRTLAAQLGERARKGESFDGLVDQYSDGADSRYGGWIAPYSPGTFEDTAHAAILALKAGEISDPIQSPAGFMVIRMVERESVTFEQTREELMDAIRSSPSTAEEEQAALGWCREKSPLVRPLGPIGRSN